MRVMIIKDDRKEACQNLIRARGVGLFILAMVFEGYNVVDWFLDG